MEPGSKGFDLRVPSVRLWRFFLPHLRAGTSKPGVENSGRFLRQRHLPEVTAVAESKSRLTGEFARGPCGSVFPICRKVRSAFRWGCLEVGHKTACDFAHERRAGHLHAGDFLVVEHHLLG